MVHYPVEMAMWDAFGKIAGQPRKLRCVDSAFVSAVGREADGVQHDKVHAFVVETVVRLADMLLVVRLAVDGVRGQDHGKTGANRLNGSVDFRLGHER